MVRHPPRRQEKEQQYQRLALIGGGAIVLVVAALLGVGWYQSYISPYHQTVVTVGNRHATMDYFIKRLNEVLPQINSALKTQAPSGDPEAATQAVLGAGPKAALDDIESDFIVLQRGPQAGATATDQQVQNEMDLELGLAAPAGAAPPRAALESALTQKLGKSGLTLAQFREEARAQVLARSMQDKLVADYPRTGPAATYDEIIASDQAGAKKLLDRLNGGESWDAIKTDVKNNPAMGTVGSFDMQPKIQTDDTLAGALYGLNPGDHTDVVATADGRYAIALLIAKDDQHQYTDDQLKAVGPKLYRNWLDDQRKSLVVKEHLTDDQKIFALAHSSYTPPAPNQGPAGQAPAQINYNPSDVQPGISTPTGGFGPGAAPVGGAPGR